MTKLAVMLLLAMGLAFAAEEGRTVNSTDTSKVEARERVKRITEKDATTTELVCDAHDRVIVRRVKVGTPQEASWRYTYSETGQRLSEETPDGSLVLYEYETPASKKPKRVRVFDPDGKEQKPA